MVKYCEADGCKTRSYFNFLGLKVGSFCAKQNRNRMDTLTRWLRHFLTTDCRDTNNPLQIIYLFYDGYSQGQTVPTPLHLSPFFSSKTDTKELNVGDAVHHLPCLIIEDNPLKVEYDGKLPME